MLVVAAHHAHDVAGVLCTLLWIVFIVAIVIAAVGLLASLVTRVGGRGPGWLPWGWLYPACVALVAGLLLLFLC